MRCEKIEHLFTIFNALALGVVVWLRWRKLLPGQHFHLYLIAYGSFRFLHEFWRETPAIVGPLTGYQIASVLLVLLGAVRFVGRQRQLPLRDGLNEGG